MYCVIQKLINKKPNPFGEYKELRVEESTFTVGEKPKSYYYSYSEERFERSIRDAYKISIHSSYRENGKIKKKQWAICTIGYYTLLECWPGDCVLREELEKKLNEMGITEDKLWSLVYIKLQPIIDKVTAEFEKTEEYKVQQEHKKMLKKYQKTKEEFEKKYGKDTYDYCYDVFGTLRNKDYLEKLKKEYEAQQSYYSGYYESSGSNYNYDGNFNNFSGYCDNKLSTYTEQEKEYLKVIYKAAALKLHPDIKNDNGEGMKFLNQLKEEWGI